MGGMTAETEPARVVGPDLAGLTAGLQAWSAQRVTDDFPVGGLDLLRQFGVWGAGLIGQGSPGLGGARLLRLLRGVGRASLPLGRLYEGHVNALLLVSAYGSAAQRAGAAQDVAAGRLFGVWNTEGPDPVRLVHQYGQGESEHWALHGAKTFASGGPHVTRPLLPVDGPHGRQLVLLRAEAPSSAVHAVPGSWEPLGMAATHSVSLDFTGTVLDDTDLIGQPGDYYRQPMFGAGALRFCAVQLGGADALLASAREYLTRLGRASDDVQRLRFADAYLALQAATLGLEAAERLERALNTGESTDGHGEQEHAEPVTEAQLMAAVDAVRLATENACLMLLEAVERAVGARGLLAPEPFAPLVRDLRMYLRQPAPDAARLRLGRWVLEGPG